VVNTESNMNTPTGEVVAKVSGQTAKHEKDPAAVARGRLGGLARARNTPPEIRSSDARQAVNARWAAEKTRRKGSKRVANIEGIAPPDIVAPPQDVQSSSDK
jgi:hypothetical protein